jgi:hypothetical protein
MYVSLSGSLFLLIEVYPNSGSPSLLLEVYSISVSGRLYLLLEVYLYSGSFLPFPKSISVSESLFLLLKYAVYLLLKVFYSYRKPISIAVRIAHASVFQSISTSLCPSSLPFTYGKHLCPQSYTVKNY